MKSANPTSQALTDCLGHQNMVVWGFLQWFATQPLSIARIALSRARPQSATDRPAKHSGAAIHGGNTRRTAVHIPGNQSRASLRLWLRFWPREHELLVDKSNPDQHGTQANH